MYVKHNINIKEDKKTVFLDIDFFLLYTILCDKGNEGANPTLARNRKA